MSQSLSRGRSALSAIVTVLTVNLAFSEFCECEQREQNYRVSVTSCSQRNTRCLTWGLSGYCPPRGTDPGRPRAGARAPTCCKATQWTGRTAGCGTGWRSRPDPLPWRSCLSERCPRRSGFPFAAEGSGRHRGRTGLKQQEERGERGDS